MPVQHILSALAVPVPFNSFPEGIGACSQLLFMFIALLEIFPYANQRLRHKGGFYEVSAVVVFTEWLGPARRPIQPMRPGTVETVGFFEVIDHLFKPLDTGFARHEITFYAHQ